MAWIESHQSLATHRKTLLAAAHLKIARPLFIGHLHLLWWWALDNVRSDGSLDGIPDEVIEEAAGWTRRKGAFVEALRTAGFITDESLHNWPKYGGKLQDRREEDTRRKQGRRADIRRTSAGHPQDGVKTAHVDKSREEKTRQEHPAAPPIVPPTEETAAAALPNGKEKPNAFVLYEQAIGPIPNQITAQRLIDAETEYGEECLKHTLEETALAKAKSWRYTEAILERHKAEGCSQANGRSPPADPQTEWLRKRYERGKAAQSRGETSKEESHGD